MFAFCGAVLAPATGLLCAWQLGRQGGSPLKGLVLGSGIVLGTLGRVSFLAIFIFPGYPMEPVSEPIAIAFTIPVLGASILSTRLIVRKRSGSNRFLFGGTWALLAIYMAGVFATYHMFTWPYRRALPWSASNVKEQFWTDGFLPDFSYYLCAQITEEQFLDYVAQFELERAGIRKSFNQTNEVPWWKPSPGSHEVYRLEEAQWSMEAIYENGMMWVTASEY